MNVDNELTKGQLLTFLSVVAKFEVNYFETINGHKRNIIVQYTVVLCSRFRANSKTSHYIYFADS